MATIAERKNAEEAKKFYDLKQKVVEYYHENGAPKKMEEVLNTMFYDNPTDVFGYLANYFEDLSRPPTITKVKAREALDSKGQLTLQTDVHCLVKNHERLVASCVSSSYGYLADGAKVEEKEEEDKWREESVTEALTLINTELSEKLRSVDPTLLQTVDSIVSDLMERLRLEEADRVAREKAEEAAGDTNPAATAASVAAKVDSEKTSPKKGSPSAKLAKGGKSAQAVIPPDEPRELFIKGSNCMCAISQAVCIAGANIKQIPVYEYVAQIKSGEPAPAKFKLPLPLVTVMQAGKASAGKLRCVKDFMIVPRPDMPVKESIKHIAAIYTYVGNSLYAKFGVNLKNTNEVGALCPPFDKPEQGLDLLQEAITHQGLQPATDFNIVLNCAAHEIFDCEKGKYEVSVGQVKGFDDMPEFWLDLLTRYPSINGLIDPMRKQEGEQWMRLCQRASTKCYIMGDYVYHRPGRLKDEELLDDLQTSAVLFRLEQMNTVSDILTCAHKMEEASNQIILSTCQGETSDTFIVDLAVGMGARFVKIGSPSRGERVAKLNRLLQIEDLLVGEDRADYHGAHIYPTLEPPPPADVQIPDDDPTEERGEEEGKPAK